ncbi:MAG: ThuA domain-containing protein [Candidatus Hydrogenedentes bacterium]|nr:ThuA domain-containing protein [Candidatus Hydrogenedentota bacterium]
MQTSSKQSPIKLAVITGRHPYDVQGFHDLFRAVPGVDFYMQHLEAYATSPSTVRAQYDVVLFYNMHIESPARKDPWYELGTREAMEQLGQSNQGVFVLHHAIVAFPDWPLFDELVGIENRRTDAFTEQSVRVHVSNPDHPITRGLTDWDMVDEVYLMPDAGAANNVLLTTDYPKSMKTLAWTRQYKESRVFCLQSGHDTHTFTNANFREVVSRGIAWCGGRI